MRGRIVLGTIYAIVLAGACSLATGAAAECNTAPVDANEFVVGLEEIVVDVLANSSDAEGHILDVEINSMTCPGTATVDFGMVTLDPEPRLFGDCSISYSVIDELGSSANAIIHVTMPTGIFSDGFESGDASKWSACDPSCP